MILGDFIAYGPWYSLAFFVVVAVLLAVACIVDVRRSRRAGKHARRLRGTVRPFDWGVDA